jgi:TP901 family phage tail tape measure protein
MANVVGRLPVGADTRPLENDISRALSKGYQLKGLNEKAFSQPLGRITGSVDEFRKSLDASNARVLAFGASAGAIFAVQKSFQALISTTIQVQKNLTDINSILGLSTKNLSNFGDKLFKIAGQTGQSFETVSQAAVEFSRQGLGVEETLKRTRDALILTRLSGLDVVASTQALTATINSFNKVALDSTEIVNKLATVDAAFAVSSGDLAEAISRVGSSADSVGVNLDQLVALVTSVQQTTARGGAVIGNSLKTIFTRLERTDVLDQLEALGIQGRNLDGSFKPAIDTLTQLAQKFDGLSDSQRANVAELVGGVFQINILKAALGDLGKQYSTYNSALNTSTGATDAAVKRNEQLNQTLSALINKTSANFTKLASDVGGLTLGPAIQGVLGNVNSALESFNISNGQGPGEKLAKGLLEGLGNYISGPGLALIGAVIGKLFVNLAKFSGQAVGQILDINKGVQQQAEVQQKINSILSQNPNLIQGILNKEISLLEVENQILGVIKAQTVAREQAAAVSATLTAGLIGRGVTSTGGKISAKSGGFIPNFSSPEQTEVYGAYLGGYKPGSVSRMNIPGEGEVVYNKAEQVKQFAGMSQPAIMPPQESSAGKNYAQAFQNKLGFNPYAAIGYVPNFAAPLVRAIDDKELRMMLSKFGKGFAFQNISDAQSVRAYSSSGAGTYMWDANSRAGMSGSPKMSDKQAYKQNIKRAKNWASVDNSSWLVRYNRDKLKNSELLPDMETGGASVYLNPLNKDQIIWPIKQVNGPRRIFEKDIGGFLNDQINNSVNSAIGFIPNFKLSPNQLVDRGYELISKDVHDTLSKKNSPFNQYVIGNKEDGYFIKSDVESQALAYYKKETEAEVLSKGKGILSKEDRKQTNAVLVYPAFSGGGLASTTAKPGKHEGGPFLFSTFGFPGPEGGIGPQLYDNVQESIKQQLRNFIKQVTLNPKDLVDSERFNNYVNNNINRSTIESAVGGIFEAGLKSAIFSAVDDPNAPLDLTKNELQELSKTFKGSEVLRKFSLGEVKNALNPSNAESMADKIASSQGYPLKPKKNKALGFIPNYSPLMASMIREMSAGVSPSSIRVGQDSRLSSSENPLGLGVYNTKDEPSGLGQGIARFKDIFAARKSGAARGFIPNYAPLNKYQRINLNNNQGDKVPFGQGGGALAASILLPTITGAVSSALPEDNIIGRGITSGIGNIGSYALTGAAIGGGAPGAIIGGLFGAVTTLIDIQKQLDEEPFKKLEKSIQSSQEKLNYLNDTFSKFNGISEKLNEVYTGNIKLSTEELAKLQSAQVATLASLPAETRNAILEALGKGDTLKVQQIQTDILETQQSKVKAQQAEQTAEALKLAEKPGFLDRFLAASANVGAGESSNLPLVTPEQLRLQGNSQEIQKALDARQTELKQFASQRLEGGQSIGDVIAKLSTGGAKPEEIRSKLLGLKSQFKNAGLYAEYIKDFDIQGFLDTLDKAVKTKGTIETNAQLVKDTAKGFLDSLENNITETNRVFSEGETNIANVTAQIQSRRGTFLESIKDLFGEFTQLNVSKQFDDAVRNAEFERSKLEINKKRIGSLAGLGAGEVDKFRISPSANTETVGFINEIQANVNNLNKITDFNELQKQITDLSTTYYESSIKYSTSNKEVSDAAKGFADELQKTKTELNDLDNQSKSLNSTYANSKRISEEEYNARLKLLRVQQAVSFAGGIQSYQQNAFPNRIAELNYSRMNLGSSDIGTRGRGALGILDQLKQLGIGPTNLPKELTDIAQAGLEADLKKYLAATGQNLSKEEISKIADKQIKNYAKQDEAMTVNIPNIDTTVSDIATQLKDEGIKIDDSSITKLAEVIKGKSNAENPGTINGQPTNANGEIISQSPFMNIPLSPFVPGSPRLANVPLFSELDNITPTNPGKVDSLTTAKSILKANINQESLQKKILEHYTNSAQQLINQEDAEKNLIRDQAILDDSTLSILEKNQKLTDLYTRDVQLDERRLKFRQDEIDKMNDLVDLANGYLSSTEYANKELERQQNAARKPGYNPIAGVATNFVNEMSYNRTQFFQDVNASAVDTARNIKSSFSNAFQSVISGTQTAGDAFKDFGIQILQQIQQITTEISTKLFIGGIFNQLQGAIGNGSGLSSLFNFSRGGLVKGYAGGGYVNSGSGNKDDVPAMLSKGEFVLNKRAVRSLQQAYGSGFLHSINATSAKGMADGGFAFNRTFDNRFNISGLENTSGLNTKDIKAGISNLSAYIDQLKGENIISSELSNYALSDPESIKNKERMQAEQDYYNYMGSLQDSLNSNSVTLANAQAAYNQQLDRYNRQKQQGIIAGFVSAGLGIAGGALGSIGGIGGAFGSGATRAGGSIGGSTGFGASIGVGSNGKAVTSSTAGTTGGSPFLQNIFRSGSRKGYASGGQAQDDIPALLMGGEFVVSKNAVKKYGSNFFEKLNRGQVKGFAEGGQIGNQVFTGSESSLTLDSLTKAIADLQSSIETKNTSSSGDTNNITISINMESDGKTSESSDQNNQVNNKNGGASNKDKNMREFTDLIKSNVITTIIEQKRPGGLLSKTNQS